MRKILRKTKFLLVFALILLLVRSLPYLAPIRAGDLVQEQLAVEFSDRHGLPLGTILSRDRNRTSVVPLQKISPHFIRAILAAEDGRFYHHGAIEMRAIARSIFQAIQAKRLVSGASTITMQLARMLEPAPRTLKAKLQEIWLSWRIAAGMNKDEILAAYINRLPMGGNIYGVEAASRIYFGIPASDLNLAQASLLAAIPNNPNYLNPYEYWEPLKKRQKYVLDRMVEDKYITVSQRDRAHEEVIAKLPRQQGIIAAPHFLFWLAEKLPKEHPAQIQTTLNRSLQQFVEAQVKEIVRSLAPHNVQQGAAIVIDNHTGEVLAYVGSTDYFANEQLGRNDGVQALRQPGSTLKPFLYELALEKRIIRPNTVLADVPTYYAIPGAKLYNPSDYSETFQGPVRVRLALANSLNIPAVKVLEKVGVANFLKRLQLLGFEHLKQDPEYYGLGLTLGSGEVSLWELARAYFQLSQRRHEARGTRHEGRQLSVIGNQLSPSSPRVTASPLLPLSPSPTSPLSSKTRSLITNILSDRYGRAKAFGVDSVLNLPFAAAVKTGTSSNYRDTWTVGYTTDYTVATWVGNFDGEPMQQVSGVTGAAPLWNRIMLHLHQNNEPAPFPPPLGMVQRPICALSGLKPTGACPSIVQEYFYPEDLAEYESKPDTFYQTVASKSELNLPPEYNEWLARRSPSFSSNLKILSPNRGDYFLTDTARTQRLEFKLGGVSNPNQSVEWWLNGEKIATNSVNSLFWQMRPGTWTLEVKSGEMTDKVTFEVQVAQKKENRRGFSVKND